MSRRTPNLPDHGLWDEVKRTIQPLPGKHESGSRHTVALRPTQSKSQSSLRIQEFSPSWMSRAAPPLPAGLDRRTAQRLARGQIEPDARLDLHGNSREQARIALFHFLHAEQKRGSRFVLVITGKGTSPYTSHTLHTRELFHSPEREGRLRRDVPEWLSDDPFRGHVVGIQPAHPRHGGGGAFYIKLRRLARMDPVR